MPRIVASVLMILLTAGLIWFARENPSSEAHDIFHVLLIPAWIGIVGLIIAIVQND